jgi:predicted amidohydrolase
VSRLVSVALGQITSRPYSAIENRELTLATAQDAFARGADLVVLPELIVPSYGADRERLLAVAEPLDGPTVEAWTQAAARGGGWIAGGFCESDGDVLYNTAVIVGAGGVALHYRKLHPFREEKHAFAPGDLGLPVAELPFGRVGLCVCYDLRFVETVRVLALAGAELICVPTAWVTGFDAERWDERGLAPQAQGALLQANLSQVFIACASQVGVVDGLELLGSSLVADPLGKAQLGPFPGDRSHVDLTSIDLDAVERAQVRDPLIRPREDRRTDIYALSPVDQPHMTALRVGGELQ